MRHYTIEQHNVLTKELAEFIIKEAPDLSLRFDGTFDYRYANLKTLTEKCRFLVVKIDGEIRGWMICNLTNHLFDTKVKVLQQLSFFVIPDSGRAAYLLFKKFIDIGKNEADHIITMLTSQTNIKPETLERWGFKELETLYRLEV